MLSPLRAVLLVVLLLCVCWPCVAGQASPQPETRSFNLNLTFSQYPQLLAQYTSGLVVVAHDSSLKQWQFNEAELVSEQYTVGNLAAFGGRLWVVEEQSSTQYAFSVLDDGLATANYVLVNTTIDWAHSPYWQVAVDEDAMLLYSAAMLDNSMQLHCWTFSIDDNSSALLYTATLPKPYLPAKLYLGAGHSLLLTWEDSTDIIRVDGYTGSQSGSLSAPGGVPTALAESADGRLLYVTAEWPRIAVYDSVTGELLDGFCYDGSWDEDETHNRFVSIALSGDGQSLYAIAGVTNVPIMQWLLNSSSQQIDAPHTGHTIALGLNYTGNTPVAIAAQYTGATVVVQRSYTLVRWQLNNSLRLSESTLSDFLATSYRGRIWTASNAGSLTWTVLNDQLMQLNSWDVNCTLFTPNTGEWQMAVDEEAGLLYSAGMLEQTMQLYAWQIGPQGNTTSLVFVSKLPTPYLPATLYPGANHTLLVTYEDDTHIYRICGWSGMLLSVFDKSTTVPTAVVESQDGRVLYVSYKWPSMAAYDSTTGELLMYYDYTDAKPQSDDAFVSASISGDGQWLLAYAQAHSLVVQWPINTTVGSAERDIGHVAELRVRAAPAKAQLMTE